MKKINYTIQMMKDMEIEGDNQYNSDKIQGFFQMILI